MGTNSQGILKPISGLLALSLAISGCSKLEFETSDKLISQSDLISESFTAKGDYSDKSVDVLVVVDNSYSMEVEQEKLGQRLDRFISSLRGVDWQIGVTTTDVSMGNYGIQGSLLPLEGANGYILTPRTADYEQVFLDTITREETLNCAAEMDCPSSDEQALSAIMMAIDKRDTDNAGFFRPNADLAVIILTDEDEKSNGPDDATQPFEVQEHLATHLPGKTATVFGIISQVGDTTCADANGLDVGVFSRHAQELSELTGGVVGSICDQDYSKSLSKIGEVVVSLMNSVTLKRQPDPETLDLQFRPAIDVEYTIEGKKLVFSKPLPEDTKILVAYRRVGWDRYLTDEQREQQSSDDSGDDDDRDTSGDDADDGDSKTDKDDDSEKERSDSDDDSTESDDD